MSEHKHEWRPVGMGEVPDHYECACGETREAIVRTTGDPDIAPVYRDESDGLHSPTPSSPANWIVKLSSEHRFGGLSLLQCPECFALVVEDFLPRHQRWHRRGATE